MSPKHPSAREEVMALMQALEKEPHHVQHVARLAVHLFDELEDLHGLGDAERALLEFAALLHDIGWSAAPNGRGHHRESARLIREHGWVNFSAESITLMAQVARYHRKSMPDLEHEDYAALSPRERERIQLLAGLLRIADGLDRGHTQNITHLSADIQPGIIVVHLSALRSPTAEIAAATRKSDLARLVFRRDITFASVVGGGRATWKTANGR